MYPVQVLALEKKVELLTANLTFLTLDQKKALERSKCSKNKGFTWSVETLRTAFQIRFVTGVHGYQFMRELGYPLPSYRTLCSRVQHVEFKPGLQFDIINLLSVKLAKMCEQEKDVVLMLDEMQVESKLEFDKGLNTFLGMVSDEVAVTKHSLNNSTSANLATHALVFMIRGLTANWKQVIAYYLTGNSIMGNVLWQITRNIISLLADGGMNVRAVVSDMGAANRAMWKVAGVVANREIVKSSIAHPVFPGQQLYFLADVPHVLKNIRNCLLSQDIILPNDVVHEFGLPCPTVSISHIRKVIDVQAKSTFKIAPSLSKKHVNPKQYEKMKVNIAAQLLSHSTASAIRYAVHDGLLPVNALTTAWFVEIVNAWFDAANARHRLSALYAKSGQKIKSLLLMMDIAPQLSFASSTGQQLSSWKPIQTGILMSTQSLLDLFASLVGCGTYSYLLTSRLTQDALENLFSQVRGRGNSHPNPVHFRQCLRLISISHYLAVPKRSSYNTSECTFAVSLLKPSKKTAKQVLTNDANAEHDEFNTDDIGIVNAVVNCTASESNALCYLTGWIAFKLKSQLKSCISCVSFLVSEDPADKAMPQAQLTVLKSYGWLTIPSQSLQQLILAAESIFQQNQVESVTSCNALELLLHKSVNLLSSEFSCIPSCHNVGNLVLKKFFRLRCHIYANGVSKLSKEEIQFGSKSAKARTTVK